MTKFQDQIINVAKPSVVSPLWTDCEASSDHMDERMELGKMCISLFSFLSKCQLYTNMLEITSCMISCLLSDSWLVINDFSHLSSKDAKHLPLIGITPASSLFLDYTVCNVFVL